MCLISRINISHLFCVGRAKVICIFCKLLFAEYAFFLLMCCEYHRQPEILFCLFNSPHSFSGCLWRLQCFTIPIPEIAIQKISITNEPKLKCTHRLKISSTAPKPLSKLYDSEVGFHFSLTTSQNASTTQPIPAKPTICAARLKKFSAASLKSNHCKTPIAYSTFHSSLH